MARILIVFAGLSLLAGCHLTGSVGSNHTPGTTWEAVSGPHDKVDLLFMVDDSPSMTPKQTQLQAAFPNLLSEMQALATRGIRADYHIGVITSDLGAPGAAAFGCPQPGDGGRLQPLGHAAPAGCQPPTGGLDFIDYDQRVTDLGGEVRSNLPPGQDLATTFTCMASVGAAGCGFEAQLESLYLALHDPPPENHDFLRPDALLGILVLSDEDDCSAPPDTDLFDPQKNAAPPDGYGELASYRCSNFGVECGGQLLPYGDSGGPLSGCQAAPNPNGMGPGKLYDVSRYVDFFTRPAGEGGLKINPADVLWVDLTGPASPVSTVLAQVGGPGPYQGCSGPIGPQCQVVLQHSCTADNDPDFAGDPAVRIRQVASAIANHQSSSICDLSYEGAMEGMGGLLAAELPGGCLSQPLADPAHPQCEVNDVTANPDGTTTVASIPACAEGVVAPCWRIAADAQCPSRLTVDRATPIPPSTVLQARCLVATP